MRAQLALILFALAAFSFTSIDLAPLKVDATQSTINWVGKKVTGKHTGTMKLKEGSIDLKKGKLTGGSFVIDMTSLKVTDGSGGAAKLEGHLSSDDFFGTSTHPTASLKITNVKDTGAGTFDVTADLTIKGITHPVMFSTLLAENTAGASATAKIVVDRTKYDVKFRSGKFYDALGDKMIYDDFELNVNILATK